MTRILLQFQGGEIELFRYKKHVPIQQVTYKLATIATEVFGSWEWGQGIPAIEQVEGPLVLIAVDGPNGKECFL